MNNYFDKDVKKLCRIKKGLFVSIATTVILGALTIALAVSAVVGQNTKYPMSNEDESKLAEICENSPEYKQAYNNYTKGLDRDFEEGKISKEQFDEEMQYIESPVFVDKIVQSNESAGIVQRSRERKETFENCGDIALATGLTTGAGVVASALLNKKKKRLEKRWFEENDL